MGKKILIVDDEALICKVLSIRLGGLGYEVFTALDGEDGLAAAKREKPDLLLLDIGLPKIDGNELCGLIKADPATSGARVIMLTGRDPGADAGAALPGGADMYVVKPYDWAELLDGIRKLTE